MINQDALSTGCSGMSEMQGKVGKKKRDGPPGSNVWKTSTPTSTSTFTSTYFASHEGSVRRWWDW